MEAKETHLHQNSMRLRDYQRVTTGDKAGHSDGVLYDTWYYYYMAVPHKVLELPNSPIWLAEIDLDSGAGI